MLRIKKKFNLVGDMSQLDFVIIDNKISCKILTQFGADWTTRGAV